MTIPRKIENFSNSSQIFKFLFKNLKSRKRRSNPPMIKTVSVRSRGTAAVFAIVGHWPTHHQLFHRPTKAHLVSLKLRKIELNEIFSNKLVGLFFLTNLCRKKTSKLLSKRLLCTYCSSMGWYERKFSIST